MTASQPETPTPAQGPSQAPAVVPHSRLENVLGVLTGTWTVSFGVSLLTHVGAVTGGTAGLAIVVSYALGLPFGVMFVLVNLPFFAVAVFTKGWQFTVRSLVSVVLVSVFASAHAHFAVLGDLASPYAVLTGNLLVGIGLLIVFRHGSSLGGFNIVALLAQERLGLRAGYVQMVLDVCVVLAGFAVQAPAIVLLSAVGAALLNLVLAINHRPGRYTGA
ncbi:YitT family protein [Nocardioides bruguierae]|uniref:YitT family protein n=1 Tax=Nocardioides bruguierae TaxID=2945102 RepID=UPI002021FCC3|nr:YitT family protein [Nocardioides bruguierae]MCL8024847.1 YitT family protein [Nocardioides bruguierae]